MELEEGVPPGAASPRMRRVQSAKIPALRSWLVRGMAQVPVSHALVRLRRCWSPTSTILRLMLARACVHQVYRHHVADMLLLLGALVTFAATELLNPRLTYIPVDSLNRYSYPVKVSAIAGRWCHKHPIPPR